MYTYVIGDIHGMRDMLERLLDTIPLDARRDALVFLGDYIDRGPDSRGVIESILALMGQGIKVVCLMGNHEIMWRRFIARQDTLTFLVNGGRKTLDSYRESGTKTKLVIPPAHLDFLDGLRSYYEVDEFLMVHAGLRPGVELSGQIEDDLFWIREDFIHSSHDFGKRIIFGHTPFDRPHVDRYKIGIDTGAVYGNRLTCVRLPDLVFYSVGRT